MNETILNQFKDDFLANGFAFARNLIDDSTVEKLRIQIDTKTDDESTRRKNGKLFAIRNLISTVPYIREFLNQHHFRQYVEILSGLDAFPVRGTLFDKIKQANWRVPWHQDLVIAVKEKIETESYSGWSIKKGILHVRPPLYILQNMIAIRIYLDDCTIDNGPIRFIPGTHTMGYINEELIPEIIKSQPVIEETVKAGSIIAMSPLILHSSQPSKKPDHRRVIHLDFANIPLDNGLQWYED